MLIYLAVNKQNGLKYVGATTLSLLLRQKEHKHRANCDGKKNHSRFHLAIREFGWSAFEWSILSYCTSKAEMLAEECRWIEQIGTRNPTLGYNMTRGGCGIIGYQFSEATRQKLSKAGMGRIKSEETRRKLSVANKGKKPSEATMKGVRNRVWTEEQRHKLRSLKVGKPLVRSDEGCQRSYEASQRRKARGVGKIPNEDLDFLLRCRSEGKSFASLARGYELTTVALFRWLENRRAP